MPENTPQQSARRWKRIVILAVLLLAGGAVVNVAVAWGIGHRVEMGKTGIQPAIEQFSNEL